MKPSLVLRPRLVWLVLSPAGFLWSLYGAIADPAERLYALGFTVAFGFWASYLWVTRIEVKDGNIVLKRMGEVKRSVRLDDLKRWDSYWGGRIPTPTLVIEDSSGQSLSIDGIWWARWSELKELVVVQKGPKADIREDLGSRPVRTTLLIGIGGGVSIGASALITMVLLQGESLSYALPVAASVGALVAVVIALTAWWEYQRAGRKQP